MKSPISLVQSAISEDTVEALKAVLAEAERGDVLGLSLVVIHKKSRSFSVETTGEARRNPILALGTLTMLDEHLRRQAYK
jgi:hypothetical protein